MEFLVDIKNMMIPEMIIAAGMILSCLLSIFHQKSNKSAYSLLSIILIGAFSALFFIDTSISTTAFFGSFLSTQFTVFFKGLILIGSIFTVLISDKYIKSLNKTTAEFYTLLLTAILGGMILVSSNDLITLFVGIETLSISTYLLCGFIKEQETSSEATLKYLISGTIASAVLLYGLSFLYGISGSLQFSEIKTALLNPNYFQVSLLAGVLVVSGLCFKIAAVPFYSWAPDVYQGAPLPVSAFLSVASKIAGFGILIRIMSEFLNEIGITYIVLGLISMLTMSVGNILALRENNIKRLMAYSSIAHTGYILAALFLGSTLSVSAVIFYLITYIFMNFAAWGCIETIDKTPNTTINDFQGLAYKRPFISAAMLIALVSLAGLPFFVGFFSKFYLFQSIIFTGFEYFPFIFIASIIVTILLNSLLALFYYFKVIKSMFTQSSESISFSLSKRLSTLILITTLFTTAAGIFSNKLIILSQQIAQSQVPIIIQYENLRDDFINGI